MRSGGSAAAPILAPVNRPPPAPSPSPIDPALLPRVDKFRPTTRRQRLVIMAVAAATVVVLWLLLLYRPGGNPYRYVQPPPAPCTAGQTSGCVGGQSNVLLLPAAPPASGPSAAR